MVMKGATKEKLLGDVVHKDKWFRISQTIFMFVVIISLAFLTVFQFMANAQSQEQDRKQIASLKSLLEEQSKTVDDINKNTTEKFDLTLAYIRCLATLSVERDENTRITIDDLETCQLQLSPEQSNAGGSNGGVSLAPSRTSGSNSPPVQNNTSPSAQQPGPSNPNPNPPNPDPEPPQNGGIILLPPVCVPLPFLAVCTGGVNIP